MQQDFPHEEFEKQLMKIFELFQRNGGVVKTSFEIMQAIIHIMYIGKVSKEKIKEKLCQAVDFYFILNVIDGEN